MSYIIFNVAVSIAYLAGMMVLARELRASTKAERRETQSVPLLISATVLYVVVISKTYQLAQLTGFK